MSDDHHDRWGQYETEVDPSEIEAADDEVICHLCGGVYGQITAQHLDTAHDTTLDKYQEKHPDAPIYPDDPDKHPGGEFDEHSEETKQQISRKILQLHQKGHYE